MGVAYAMQCCNCNCLNQILQFLACSAVQTQLNCSQEIEWRLSQHVAHVYATEMPRHLLQQGPQCTEMYLCADVGPLALAGCLASTLVGCFTSILAALV